MRLKNKGFTFIEAVTVVGMICIMATITVVAMKSLRISSRDTKRVSDITEIRSALNLYYAKYSQYPTAITSGESFKIGSVIYLEKVPFNPAPRNDGSCGVENYVYETQEDNTSYTLRFCLGGNAAGLQAGYNLATPNSINPDN